MIERHASAVQVVGNAQETGCNHPGKASTGQRIPESNKTGNSRGMFNCIAWNSDFALLEITKPRHMAAQPSNRQTVKRSKTLPLIGMSNPSVAMAMTTVT